MNSSNLVEISIIMHLIFSSLIDKSIHDILNLSHVERLAHLPTGEAVLRGLFQRLANCPEIQSLNLQ